jgi:hypothetical protein
VGDLGKPACFEDNAYDALVDDRGRATALRHKSFADQLSHGSLSPSEEEMDA